MSISDWSSYVRSSDLGSMVEAIRSDTAIGDEEKELPQAASVPLYKILTVQAAYGRGMATDDRDKLAEIASIHLLYAILERITDEAGRSVRKSVVLGKSGTVRLDHGSRRFNKQK